MKQKSSEKWHAKAMLTDPKKTVLNFDDVQVLSGFCDLPKKTMVVLARARSSLVDYSQRPRYVVNQPIKLTYSLTLYNHAHASVENNTKLETLPIMQHAALA